MSTLTKATSRGQSEADTLADAKAMYDAAHADADVAKKLGPAYLKRMMDDLDHAEGLVHGKLTVQHDKLAEGAHVVELAGELLVVLQDIRDSADEQTATVKHALGVGASWHANQPTALATAAHGVAVYLHDHKEVAKAIDLDKQHAHDLAHLADAIDEAHGHHVTLGASVKSDAIARKKLLAALRARVHHVRLKARIAHRKDPAKLAAFGSPVAHHRVAHHAASAAKTRATLLAPSSRSSAASSRFPAVASRCSAVASRCSAVASRFPAVASRSSAVSSRSPGLCRASPGRFALPPAASRFPRPLRAPPCLLALPPRATRRESNARPPLAP